MKNTVLIYDKISGSNFTSEDYTSKRISNIRNMKELNDSAWIEYIELYDNQTIEQISFILYDTPDYWDLLLVINDKDPLFDMSYDFDILEQISEDKVQKYLDGYSGVYKNDTYERLKEITLKEDQDANEMKRQLKIIKPDRLYDFMNLLKDVKL
jgi:hypothetical protein